MGLQWVERKKDPFLFCHVILAWPYVGFFVLHCCIQFHKSGNPYLLLCVETAAILAATRASSEVVAASLLHDVVDDSNLSHQFLQDSLGDDIVDLVLGVSKLYLA
jgi:(p)ppGpp synthase/HD superfamily hydrolase